MHKAIRDQHLAATKLEERERRTIEVARVEASGSTFGSGATYDDCNPLGGSGPISITDA